MMPAFGGAMRLEIFSGDGHGEKRGGEGISGRLSESRIKANLLQLECE